MWVTFTISREMFVNAIGIQTVVYGVLLQVSMLLYCTDTQWLNENQYCKQITMHVWYIIYFATK